MTRLSARDVIAAVIDGGSWTLLDGALPEVPASREYADELACARTKTGLDESVGKVGTGHRLADRALRFERIGHDSPALAVAG
jgi:acyl-CoA carboxylase subunit beta